MPSSFVPHDGNWLTKKRSPVKIIINMFAMNAIYDIFTSLLHRTTGGSLQGGDDAKLQTD
jgi:hypothetical protein